MCRFLWLISLFLVLIFSEPSQGQEDLTLHHNFLQHVTIKLNKPTWYTVIQKTGYRYSSRAIRRMVRQDREDYFLYHLKPGIALNEYEEFFRFKLSRKDRDDLKSNTPVLKFSYFRVMEDMRVKVRWPKLKDVYVDDVGTIAINKLKFRAKMRLRLNVNSKGSFKSVETKLMNVGIFHNIQIASILRIKYKLREGFGFLIQFRFVWP